MAPSDKRCRECGAELKLGPAACPLCGSEPPASLPPEPPESEVERYYSNVRALRSELSKLRSKGARAS